MINDILMVNKLHEKGRLVAVDYDPFTKRMVYKVELKNEKIVDANFDELTCVRYLR